MNRKPFICLSSTVDRKTKRLKTNLEPWTLDPQPWTLDPEPKSLNPTQGRCGSAITHNIELFYISITLTILALGVLNNTINTTVTRIGSGDKVGGLMGVLDTSEKVKAEPPKPKPKTLNTRAHSSLAWSGRPLTNPLNSHSLLAWSGRPWVVSSTRTTLLPPFWPCASDTSQCASLFHGHFPATSCPLSRRMPPQRKKQNRLSNLLFASALGRLDIDAV